VYLHTRVLPPSVGEPPENQNMAIRTIKIHPSIGIARIGNSISEFFIGPELPGDHAAPPGGYKDAQHRIKRQAARFRIFGYDENDRPVQEITTADATVTWTVHLANTKAAGDLFHGVGTQSPGVRNVTVTGSDRKNLVIDPGPRSITGPNQAEQFNSGRFMGVPVPLGEMRTDTEGRLVVLGGFGNSGSPINAPLNQNLPFEFANHNGWYDDVSDGPVTAVVTLNGTRAALEAVAAWVLCPPPKYAPAIEDIITLYDVLYQNAVEKGWITVPSSPSFNNDIFPILQRAINMKWLYGAAADAHSSLSAIISMLGNARARKGVVARHRDPSLPADQPSPKTDMPRIWSDIFPKNGPINAALTKTQYNNMKKWAAGNFVNDWTGKPPEPAKSITPEGVDRAALENCVGAAFCPGIETSWKTRDQYEFIEPFRLDWKKRQPGDLTQQMSLPWQTDFLDCSDGDVPLLWWPAHRPNQVWPEDGGPQVDWDRIIALNPEDFLQNWPRMGFVISRGERYVETERQA